jgi:protoporphyrinogen oxidase
VSGEIEKANLDKPRLIILGAGVSGLSAALYLAENAPEKFSEIIVIEKDSRPGGLISSTEYGGRFWDNGIFIFFRDSPLVKLFSEEFSVIENHQQLAWHNNRLDKFPIPVKDVLARLPKSQIGHIMIDYFYSRVRLRLGLSTDNFHDWLRYRLTPPILEHSGLENYIEKLQGLKLAQLSDRLGPERFSSIDSATRPLKLLSSIYQGLRGVRQEPNGNPMYYFSRGANSVSEKLASLCVSKGVNIYYGSKVSQICHGSNNILNISLSQAGVQKSINAHYIIATNPINDILDICKPIIPNKITAQGQQLIYRKMMLLFFSINKRQILSPHLLLYSLDPKQPWKRLKAHSQTDGTTSLIVEIPIDSSHNDLIDPLIKTTTGSLVNDLKLFKQSDIIMTYTKFIREAYPIYKLGHENITSAILSELAKHKIFASGRQGAFRYLSSDKAISMAVNSAADIFSAMG